jgi:LacI family transcriptional regulator
MITSPPNYKVTLDRTEGFLSELRKEGIEFNPYLSIPGDWHFSGGYTAAKELMNRNNEFSALFVHNDDMAMGAILAINEAGFRVPDDISIIGYDNLPVTEHVIPPLTTVWQPRHEIGNLAVRMVLDQISGKQVQMDQTILLKPKLIHRNSVKLLNT